MTREEYLSLVKKLNEYSKSYHEDNESKIADAEYDKLYRDLKKYESTHPSDVVKDSPTQRVGEAPTQNKVKHVVRMYSLENAFNDADMMRYLKRFTALRKSIGNSIDQYYVDYKMDGLSVELVYVHGKLTRCVTRGDGKEGEDVTPNALTISNLPQQLNTFSNLIVRGEVVVHHNDFDAVNAERVKCGLQVFSNCRNYAAGSLTQKDPEVTRHRKLKFYAWEMINANNQQLLHSESMKKLAELGFSVPKGKICTTLKEIMTTLGDILAEKDTLPFDIDGAVIKLNNPAYYPRIGWNSHAPLFNIAYKFPAKRNSTTIQSIRWGMGRTGKLTPVASIDPVVVDGVTVTNVTLNNVDYVEQNKIGPGTVVEIIRSGEVIPKIATVVKSEGYTGIPTMCPFCNSELYRNGPTLQCNCPTCKEKLKARLSFLVGKDCLNIKGYGDKFMAELVDSESVTTFLDVFMSTDSKSSSIKQDDLNDLIVKIRNIDLVNLISVLNIPGCGKNVAGKLAQEADTLSKMRYIFGNPDRLKNISIGNSVKTSILDWYSESTNKEFIDRLVDLELPNC